MTVSTRADRARATQRTVTCDKCSRTVGGTEDDHDRAYFARGDAKGHVYCRDCANDLPFSAWPSTRGTCRACGLHMVTGVERSCCSDECRHEYVRPARARARRGRRQAIRESERPDTFACAGCGEPIDGTVVFWWRKWDRVHDVTWCEPCWAAMQTEEDRERFERYGDEPSMFGIVYPNPDAKGYDPFAQIGRFDPRPCGHCGRSIRWGHPMGFCCERCKHEADKAARRVERVPLRCVVCGKKFTPKRSDALTCCDAHRQQLSRARRRQGVTGSGGTTRDPHTGHGQT